MITSEQRVLTACNFEPPDRIPRYDNFWKYPELWRRLLGDPGNLTDISIWYPDETPFPTRAKELKEENGYIYTIDSWGRTVRTRPNTYFVEVLDVPLSEGTNIEEVHFDSPQMDSRYLTGKMDPSVTYHGQREMQHALQTDKTQHCVFGKTGGPYLRSTYVRGEMQFLMDISGYQLLAKAIADKVAGHLIAVGIEQIRRFNLRNTGIWIFDDMAYNNGPMFSPKQFETVFLPAYRQMIYAYKNAGAKYVFLHSDGDIRPLLDMLIDAGIDGIHPLERRANMDVVKLRQCYPKLILIGGMCNTHTLIKGTHADVRSEAQQIIDLGRDGGVIIGSHSISPEIPIENFMTYHETCMEYGNFQNLQI